jgi:hypothetical protein
VNLAQAQAAIVAKARSLFGTPYVYGKTDCEWLTRTCALAIGVTIPWGATEQYDHLPHVLGALEPGDFVYFHDLGDPPGEDHCGVYICPGLMIDSPYTGAVVRYDYFSITEPHETLAYTGAVRVATLVATPDPTESDDDMAKIFVARGSTAPYLVGGVPVLKEYLPNAKCEALLELGYAIERDVDPGFVTAIPDVPGSASSAEVLPVAEPPAAEETAPEPPAEETDVVATPQTPAGGTPEETAPAAPLLEPGDPGWRQTR